MKQAKLIKEMKKENQADSIDEKTLNREVKAPLSSMLVLLESLLESVKEKEHLYIIELVIF